MELHVNLGAREALDKVENDMYAKRTVSKLYVYANVLELNVKKRKRRKHMNYEQCTYSIYIYPSTRPSLMQLSTHHM